MKSVLRRCSLWAAVWTLCLQLVACSSTPPIRFHSLLPMQSAPRFLPVVPEVVPVVPGFAFTLAPVSVPSQVDQPQWLLRNADGSLSLLEQERWVAPLRGELQGALTDRWTHGWGGRAEVTVPAKEAVWRITVDVTRWESVPGREVRLEARWSATAGSLVLRCTSVIQEAALNDASASPILALAASHRRAVTRLADEIASRLGETKKAGAARCSDARV